MKNKVALFAFMLFCVFSFGAKAQEKENTAPLIKDITYLASNKLKGREAGTKYELAAAKYIAKRFEEIGLQTIAESGSYFQAFTFDRSHVADTTNSSKKTKKHPLLTGRNVVGWIDNGVKNTIIIGAHYDHLGTGGYGSLHTGEKAVHNGADDNASGVAALLHLAAQLKVKKGANNNYLFIAFSAEELGLLGSKYYVEHALIPKSKISCMLNLDMVGRLNEGQGLTIYGSGTSPKWQSILEKTDKKELKIKLEPSGLGPSDHASFYLAEIPVLSFFTGKHLDYHKPTDDADKINYEGILTITDYIEHVIAALDPVLKLAFSKTKDEMVHDSPRRKYKVTLGVMPDYTFEGPGMRIDGVISSRPADKAGMKDGDIVRKLGHVEVIDLRSYMQALGQFDVGDKTTIEFDRSGSRMTLELEF
jgi:hypothetical protein